MSHQDTSNAQASLTAKFRGDSAHRTEFDAALFAVLRITPRDGRDGLRDGRRKRMLAVFEGRANWEQIRGWRSGRRQAPEWARSLLRAKLAADIESQQSRLARV